MQSREITALVKKAKGKDADAFSELTHFYETDMYKVAYAILLNDEDAADAIGDTILTCWEKLSSLRKEKYFKTWMTRILINHCYDIREWKSRTTNLEEYAEPEAESTDQSNVEWKEMLSVLEEKYRNVLILFYEGGYKTAEIAALLHIPASTVQTRLQRGREKLAVFYGK